MNSSDRNNHPDDLWLNQLTGIGSEESSVDGGMTEALRLVMLEKHRCELGRQPPVDNAALARLLQHCRNEGLIEVKRPWWVMNGWLPRATVMVCLLVILGVNVGDRQPTQEAIYRGLGESQAIVKLVSDPMKSAVALQEELNQAGVGEVRIFQTDDRWSVTVTLVQPLPSAVTEVLKANQLSMPKNGKVKVVFSPAK